MKSVVGGEDGKKVSHSRVNVGGLMEGPCDCWSVVAA